MAKQVYTTGQILTAAQMTTLQANDYNQTVSAKVASYTLVAADAGTRITMSNASATTITVNTSIFTAGDTLEITNIGTGVLTVTAGTATVSTSSTLALKQFDSGQLYFTSTGVAIFFASDAADSPLTTKGDLFTFSTADARLAVGATNNTVLTVDSTAATGLKYSSDYTAYTPAWTASGTAPSLGNGTLSGRFLLVGKMCFIQILFQAGSTTTFGTNEWRFSLPFTSDDSITGVSGFPCSGYVEDQAVAGYQIVTARKTDATKFGLFISNSTSLSSTSPFTWGTSDFFRISLVYGIA